MKTYWTNFGMKGLLLGSLLWAQSVGIGTSTPDASARLEVSSTNQGVLIPRVSLTSVTDAATIPSPATSLLVYNTNANLPQGAGYYYNAGTPITPRWVSINNEVVWYHRSATGSVNHNTNGNVTQIPGLAQTITVPTGYQADIEIWAQAGVGLTGGTSTSWAVADIILYRNGNFIPIGGWNRRKLHNGDGTSADIDVLCLIARETLGPGTYNYQLMSNRYTGNQAVRIGGDCAAEVNCGELKIAVRYRPQ
jgi:hypothetical protein